MLSLFGSGIGRGVAIGKAYVLRQNDVETARYPIKKENVSDEVNRLRTAVVETKDKYKKLLKSLPKSAPKESAAFIDAHMLMLSDPLLIDEAIKIIKSEHVNAEYAIGVQSGNLIKVFEQMQDAYLRAKKTDVEHVTNRLLRSLMGIVSHSLDEFSDEDLRGKIVISKDLTPAETMFVKEHNIAAFVTDLGSQISHTAIVARSLKMPAVVALHGATKYINDDDLLIVDGLRGTILVNPTSEVLKEYKKRLSKIRAREKHLSTLTGRAAKTIDGKRIQLMANVETSKELPTVKKSNAAGIGLYRTEYLFMNRDNAPTEQEQFRAYKKIVSGVEKPVIIRTLDIGGDKRLDFSYPNKRSSESPLGLRAVRLCLNHVEVFKPQLRAILRASAFGKVSIMIPMISNVDEVDQVLALIKQTKAELRSEKIAYDTRIKVGGMIEVPAAAIMADVLAKKLDFLSIGTNDLIQYTLAIDRVDDAVNYLYDPIHPAVLQLIRLVIKAGNRAGIPVSLCGEMAGNVKYTRLLLALGLRNFSMDANYVLDVKEQILNVNTEDLRKAAKKVIAATNPMEARGQLADLNALPHGAA